MSTNVTVRMPTVLRPQAGGSTTVSASGANVGEVLLDLVETHPGLRPSLLDEDGRLRKFINVYVGDEDVRFLNGLETQVTVGDEVAILPAVAGG